ncbi:ribonuclease J [Truepera radiovictrix]|uniref:Ribonuclease J n=1 Tax=Truepera radiovictrix (strain DSM 17093 / CIP 108686 / LMG 22925 / RQ-24) TaxID=649638 RepID=D7CYA3_TRURR|nr:ribonuclease J [Truepera radiovictrix]ADI14742.1 RNA-metabolising metallo-beta-lactamase [Truepera radiovictrix DSM 17093]WMT56708.1 ribonuclease J [Truepera radiovictrix]
MNRTRKHPAGAKGSAGRSTDKEAAQSAPKALRIIPLGGMGEIGKNMFAVEYEDEILLIDGGLAFPDADMLGVDILVPKIDYVVENAARVKGWVLTHGHEDHIGGIPYMLKLLPKIPMYGAKLTLGLLRGKFEEFKLKESDADLREISTDERIKISKYFTVDFFRMTHSIPDNSGLIIHTPLGRVVHSGDFKLDYNPADGKTSHLHKLAQAGQEGVLALISDSTNAERPGYTPSERDVMNGFEQLVKDAKGRVIVTTFASHIHRLQNFIRVAERYDRRVIVEGRSMVKNTRIAQELGYLETKHPLASPDDLAELADDKILFLCTGSQGQPMAALSRLAAGTHKKISLKPGDTVILSSNPIPGNEEAVGRVINQLYARGVNVFYPPTYRVHASGHASQEELKLILDLTRPKFFIPWHGEVRHQLNHQKLAAGMATPPLKSVIAENGDILELTRNDLKKVGQVDAGVLYIDAVGKSSEEITEPIIRDRQTLSSEGVVVIMALAGRNPSVEVITRGVSQNHRELNSEIEKIALENLKRGVREKRTLSDIRDDIFYPVRRYLRKTTGRNPLIVPTVIEG